MRKILRSPGEYIQGYDEIDNLSEHTSKYGDKPLIIISSGGEKRFGAQIKQSFAANDSAFLFEIFGGETSSVEIQRLCDSVGSHDCNVVVGIGGGKIIDTAKAVGHYMKIPIIIFPTVASSDAPCSSLCVIYEESGVFDKYLHLSNCPDLVLVDTQILVQADARLLAAGMGDALATYYEARAVQNSGKNNHFGAIPTATAFALAQTCRDIILKDGTNAMIACENKVVTTSFENVVEANTYLSGVGFESGGVAAAHAIQKGFTQCPELHRFYHGEIVAFCLLTQLVMENSPKPELDEVLHFLVSVGLPVCFNDFGVPDISDEMLEEIAKTTILKGPSIHNMPFAVTEYTVYSALKTADAIGQRYK